MTKPTSKTYPISKLAENEWKSFALYTVEARAIPSMIDGMKPSNRFYLYSSILNSSTDFKKVESIAGVITDYGYNHGTTSAASAGQMMAATWNNNICLVEGRGNFGTRLVPVPAATRYTQTRIHANFKKYIKDIEHAPVHSDPEHAPPAFYIPVIPLVLVNGVKGIATGFATNILPRDPKQLTAACYEYITTGKIANRLSVKFPQFNGTTVFVEADNKHICYGSFERKGKTGLLITEVPPGFDHVTYVKLLRALEEKDDIVGYENLCNKDGFRFEVKLKQNTSAGWDDDRIIKEFKLSTSFTENLTVTDHNGKLKEYTDERDLIADFCKYRFTILEKRIETNKAACQEQMRWLNVKMQFIRAVLEEKVVFKNKKKADVVGQILLNTSAIESDTDRLLRINLLSLTDEMIEELQQQIVDAQAEYDMWNTTTSKRQFVQDLKSL